MNARDHRDLEGYLSDILEAIERIAEYVYEMDELMFMSSTLVQDAVLRNLEIIGEASNKILKKFPEFSDLHTDIKFSSAYGMRNAIAHGYFKVDLEIVWRAIHDDVAEMGFQIRDLLGGEDNELDVSPSP